MAEELYDGAIGIDLGKLLCSLVLDADMYCCCLAGFYCCALPLLSSLHDALTRGQPETRQQ
jgi:hypothetical protein